MIKIHNLFTIYSTEYNAWWRAGGKGYTNNVAEAGIFEPDFVKELGSLGPEKGVTASPYEDIIYFIIPVHHKRGCSFTVQVRRFDIDGCPIFVLCNGNYFSEWVEYTYINYEDCEPSPFQFSSEPEAVAAAVKFIRELNNQ
jgi:hypothetical protein